MAGRRIVARISRFPGMGHHRYVTVRPEPTPADPDPQERVMKFSQRETAIRWVEHLLAREFDSDDTVVWEAGDETRWFACEGD